MWKAGPASPASSHCPLLPAASGVGVGAGGFEANPASSGLGWFKACVAALDTPPCFSVPRILFDGEGQRRQGRRLSPFPLLGSSLGKPLSHQVSSDGAQVLGVTDSVVSTEGLLWAWAGQGRTKGGEG